VTIRGFSARFPSAPFCSRVGTLAVILLAPDKAPRNLVVVARRRAVAASIEHDLQHDVGRQGYLDATTFKLDSRSSQAIASPRNASSVSSRKTTPRAA